MLAGGNITFEGADIITGDADIITGGSIDADTVLDTEGVIEEDTQGNQSLFQITKLFKQTFIFSISYSNNHSLFLDATDV